jgi:lysophospholipase L1-like esterase
MKTFGNTKAAAGKALLFFFSCAVTFALLELIVRLFLPQAINFYNFTLLQEHGAGEMVLRSGMLPRGERTKGYGPYVPNLSMNFGGVPVKINSRGWRDYEYSLEKPAGVTRIMVVGDSVAFGYGVKLEDMFPKVLERRLNSGMPGRYEVISFGGAGGNTYAQRNIIRNNVAIYSPDIVILAFNLNDILPQTLTNIAARKPNAGWTISRTVNRARKTLDAKFRSRSHLYLLLRERTKVLLRQFGVASPAMVRLPAFDMEKDSAVAAWRDTSAVLLEIADELKQNDIRFLLAILPVDMQMSRQVADIYRKEYGFAFNDSLLNGKPQEIIGDFARRHGISYTDLLPSFRKDPAEKKFFRIYGGSIDWNHPNRSGHSIIGEQLQNALRSLGVGRGHDIKGGGRFPPNKQRDKARAVTFSWA